MKKLAKRISRKEWGMIFTNAFSLHAFRSI